MNASGSQPNPLQIPARPRRFRAIRRFFAMLVLIVLVIGAGFLGNHLWEEWVKDQIAELDGEAEAFYAKGDLEDATRVLSNIMQRSPKEERALRLWAHILDESPHSTEDTVALCRKICALPSATADDGAHLGLALLRASLYEESHDLWEHLPPKERRRRGGLELEAALLRHDGRTKEADQILRRAYEADPDNPDSQLKLAALDLTSPFQEIKTATAQVVWKIARGPSGPTTVRAMEMLASMPGLTVTEAVELRTRLTQMPEVTGGPRYAVLSGCLNALPLQRRQMLEEEITRHHGKLGDESFEFLHWLLKNKESKRILEILDEETATHSGRLFPVYAEALNAVGDWKKLQSLLRASPPPPIGSASSAIMQAFCSYRLGDSRSNTLHHVQEALHDARSNRSLPEVLATAVGAEEMGFNDLAIEAFTELSGHRAYKMAALDHILEIRRRQDDLPEIITTLQTLLEDAPGLAPYFDQLCYHKILAGEEIEKTAALVQRALGAGRPASPTLHLALALAAYRAHDLVAAQREAGVTSGSDLPAGQRAVLAGILEACGQTGEAFQLAEKISPQLLLAEENRFLKGAL